MASDPRFPPGLLGGIATWVMASAAYPNEDIALVTAIALVSAFTSRSYCTPTGAGLNQYLLLLASTGMGKEAIASSAGKIITALIEGGVYCAAEFKGPSHIASVQALIKWLAKYPAILCIFGEFGQKLKAMAKNPSSNDTALLAGYLELYSKSEAGAIFDPMAYSDKEKNTGAINRPALTIVGETVPSVFYENLDAGMIANGLLPRFAIFEVNGARPYLNPSPSLVPPAELVASLANLVAQCLNLAQRPQPQFVQFDSEASAKFREFERWTTDQINASNSDVVRQLWNRANLKALKLASVWAVGVNYLNPVINIAATMWATDMVVSQTLSLIGKFERDEIGSVDGDEAKQIKEVITAIGRYATGSFEDAKKYGAKSAKMHDDKVVTESYLSRYLLPRAAFRNDKRGATVALKRALDHLINGDELREVPRMQMQVNYQTNARAFSPSDPTRFLASVGMLARP